MHCMLCSAMHRMQEESLAEQIRKFASREYFEPARRRGDFIVQVVAGDIHRTLKLNNRVPAVCAALRSKLLLEENGVLLEHAEGPPSGQGTRMKYTYRFVNQAKGTSPRPLLSSFLRLHGIAREVFQSLGGAETFLLNERTQFQEAALKTPK